MLADLVRTLPAYAELVARLRAGERPIVAGGAGALPGLLLAALSADLAAPLAIVVADEKASESLSEDLTAAGLTGIFHAPAPSLTPYQRIPPSLKARRDEFGLLAALRTPGAVRAAILPARSLFARLPSPQDFAALLLAVAEGDEISLPRFIARLTTVGYRRSDLVTETGDLAVRVRHDTVHLVLVPPEHQEPPDVREHEPPEHERDDPLLGPERDERSEDHEGPHDDAGHRPSEALEPMKWLGR